MYKSRSHRALESLFPRERHAFKESDDSSILSLVEWVADGKPFVWKMEASNVSPKTGKEVEVWFAQGHGISAIVIDGRVGDWCGDRTSGPGAARNLQAEYFVAVNTGVGWRLFEEMAK
ncbi:hypothetical protein FDI24_gp201 [Acidovorax phage ACP17]|uniref:Uncharacterized protein n=1 Tax=Acidovorax phage ACP17 TaxID=2010329 RepID=A0A218M347_9CAUD|nr:hypothetical protein FDI24_gp201 [Acidovorax phage ACP17]ASD50482.1 hypothetical protein [Acidovorax phage ACP17]